LVLDLNHLDVVSHQHHPTQHAGCISLDVKFTLEAFTRWSKEMCQSRATPDLFVVRGDTSPLIHELLSPSGWWMVCGAIPYQTLTSIVFVLKRPYHTSLPGTEGGPTSLALKTRAGTFVATSTAYLPGGLTWVRLKDHEHELKNDEVRELDSGVHPADSRATVDDLLQRVNNLEKRVKDLEKGGARRSFWSLRR
jgi:hypothetical protein